METINYFIIEGTKDLIFRKEGENFIFFDPYGLEYYRTNYTGAEILYLISKNYHYNQIVEHFTNEYNISEKSFKEIFSNFLSKFPLLNIIYANLIQLDIAESISYEKVN
ncbi:hypothetical protein [Clostridium tyrobutyricum]|jgi:hypothetical protein|uniref:PqqD family peptide maturation chaperone WgkC n=1 Tax=Clostridium tyrobutyricum TaxID=1519 RepID=UPI00242CAA0D|nr:hypothetical protein [Clostridium tyrobutyricum]